MDSLKVSENIVPLSEFKAHASEWLKKISRTGSPVVITQNGRAAAVLVSPGEFDAMAERDRFLRSVADGMADAEEGRLIEHAAMVAETTSRYGPPDE
jgi:prevent-host-death family protein